MLSREESARYNRQLAIPNWGEKGQLELKASNVLVAGAGALGCAVLTYLVAAGVGTVRVVDGDVVDNTNLNRQVLYGDIDVGQKKVDAVSNRLSALNPSVRIEPIAETIADENVHGIIRDYWVVDALDSVPTRYILNRAAVARGLPLFHGAVHAFEGVVTTVIPGKTPCLRCLYKDETRGNVGVAGVTAGVIGCLQATEVLKYALGIGDMLLGRMLSYDGLAMQFGEHSIRRDPDCDTCSRAKESESAGWL